MTTNIHIIDRGRGPQLSTSRITVQDLIPYLQEGCSHAEILQWIPALTVEEIAVVECYYREHQAQLDEQDRRIRARTEEHVRQQSTRFPELQGNPDERLQRLRELVNRRRQEKNGQGHPG